MKSTLKLPKPDPLDVLVVTPIEGEFGLRYKVSSRSDPENPRLVDLSFHGGSGSCSCEDFRCRRWKAIKAGARLFRKATTCEHIRAVHVYYLEQVLPRHIELAGQTPREGDDNAP